MKIEQLAPHEKVVLVTGDRDWDDLETVVTVFSEFTPNTVVVHGYANGLDTIADVVARDMQLRVIPCPAHWRHNERKCVEVWGPCPVDCCEVVGRPAGVLRNHMMYDAYHPAVVHGFHNNILNSKGTRDMLKYSMKRNTPSWLHTSRGEQILNPTLTKPRESKKLQNIEENDWFYFE